MVPLPLSVLITWDNSASWRTHRLRSWMTAVEGSVAVAGKAAQCVPPHKKQALLTLLSAIPHRGFLSKLSHSVLKAELIVQSFSLQREEKKILAAVKTSEKSHWKTKDAEVTWAEGQSYVLPLYFFKSFFVDFFQIFQSNTVIRNQLFRCIRNGSAKRLLRGHLGDWTIW